MRLLQLGTGADDVLELHPHLSVLSGVDAPTRARVVEALTALAAGRAPGEEGQLEANGLLFGLDAAWLDLLDLGTEAVEPIVRSTDLPSHAVHVDPVDLQARRSAQQAVQDDVEALEVQTAELHEQVIALAVALEEARAAAGPPEDLAPSDAPPEPVEQLLAEATARRRDAEALVAELLVASEAADARVAALHDAAPTASEIVPDVSAERPEPAGEDDGPDPADRIAEIDRLLAVVVVLDPAPVREARAQLRTGADTDTSPEALALADAIEAIDRAAAPSEPAPDPADVATAQARVDAARQVVLEAESAARDTGLDAGMVAAIEETHERLLDALEKTERRLGGSRAQRRVTELREAEQTVLSDAGFATYTDYVIGDSSMHTDPADVQALHRARAELTAAELELARVQQAADAVLEAATRLAERSALLEQASALLGGRLPGDERDVPTALRELRVPSPAARAGAQRLRESLDAVGLAVDEDVDAATLALLADAWLTEAATAAERVAALETERAQLPQEAPRRAAAASDPDVVPAPDAADPAANPGLVDLEHTEQMAGAIDLARSAATALGEAQAQLEAARRAEAAAGETVEPADDDASIGTEAAPAHEVEVDAMAAEVDRLTAAHAAALEEFEAVADALSERREQQAAGALELERLDAILAARDGRPATAGQEAEWYLLARLAAQRSVSLAGSLPIVLDEVLRDLPTDQLHHVLERLERMAPVVQVIILSDDRRVAEWAERAGPDRALVISSRAA